MPWPSACRWRRRWWPGSGREVVGVTVWVPFPTVTGCCRNGAALKLVLPAWLASTMQVPAPVKLTTPAVIVHAPAVDDPSMAKVTASPDEPWPPGCRGPAPPTAADGPVEVNVMVWEPLPTAKDCWTWGAAL